MEILEIENSSRPDFHAQGSVVDHPPLIRGGLKLRLGNTNHRRHPMVGRGHFFRNRCIAFSLPNEDPQQIYKFPKEDFDLLNLIFDTMQLDMIFARSEIGKTMKRTSTPLERATLKQIIDYDRLDFRNGDGPKCPNTEGGKESRQTKS